VRVFVDLNPNTIEIRRKMIRRRIHDDLCQALLDADVEQARAALFAAMDEGDSVATICDGPITQAMHIVGERWKHGTEGILLEHRATLACIQLLVHYGLRLPRPEKGPVAVGGTPSGDSYQVASMMVGLIFKSEGWVGINLGPDVTVEAYKSAILLYRPAAVWIACSVEEPAEQFVRSWQPLLEEAEVTRTTVLVGGRAFPPQAATASPCLRYLPNMESLVQFLRQQKWEGSK
jgi:methanogenic corrinoid protein MtbC1